MFRILSWISALVLPAALADAADLTFRVTVPVDTPTEAQVFLAGNFQGWNPGHENYRLTHQSDDTWTLTFMADNQQTLQFKFTLGDWSGVEKGSAGEEIGNRLLEVAGPGEYEFTVANWADGTAAPPRTSTRTGRVTTHQVPGFLDGRRVWVYLPPGYDTDPDRRYPVLYMADGQNVFDAATSFVGEWQVDEICERLIAGGEIRPLMVVAVDNGQDRRTREYTPWSDPAHRNGGKAREHLTAWRDILLPWVDINYRTATGPANTTIAGSSFGGLLALYGVFALPETFGQAAALSPSLWFNDHAMARKIPSRPKPPVRLYVDMGTLENGTARDRDGNGHDDAIDDLRAFGMVLQGMGFVEGEDLMIYEDVGGIHNETYWAARFPGALEFLFPVGR